ncbi:unnamed protein product (macronuclear) [Paramecium tetraurelia]|uniref:Uncharacterized protein n=1 Tax=Paramecium tetraurelia TaxID=5888 RepID=A0E9Z3_PARTE|nr:uncharacterized protein GSPATT00024841001 [Paramecium tetraurelia]CAK92110.1 unnamed protein product [Paramecium tetraurelia]|eukprot:XP_001459507.1 hypothetical protein (macronuclear) [Paramecium tetraurelia strain d4-2]
MLYLLLIPALAYVQEQYLMEIYNEMNGIKETISQLEYYTALEKLEWKARQDREFEEEGMTIYLEHFSDVQRLIKQRLSTEKKEKDSQELFLHETYFKVINLLKRLIIDKVSLFYSSVKDKLIETDTRELAKIKHQAREDASKRFDEYNFLLQKIKEVIDSPNIQDIFKTLELLESKIMIGLFKSNPSQELDFFIKGVDRLFKQSNHSNSRNEALQLLSLMHSVIQETLIGMMNEQLESSFDLLDKELFYTQSKNTHQQAKESLTTLLNKLEVTGAKFWNDQLQINGNEDHLVQMFQGFLDQAMLMSNRSIQYHQQLSETLKAMLERFLQR